MDVKWLAVPVAVLVLAGCGSTPSPKSATSTTSPVATTTTADTRPVVAASSSEPVSKVMSSVGSRWAGDLLIEATGKRIGLSKSQTVGYAAGVCPMIEGASSGAQLKASDDALLARYAIPHATKGLTGLLVITLAAQCPQEKAKLLRLAG